MSEAARPQRLSAERLAEFRSNNGGVYGALPRSEVLAHIDALEEELKAARRAVQEGHRQMGQAARVLRRGGDRFQVANALDFVSEHSEEARP